MAGPSIRDFDENARPIYVDKWGRRWVGLGTYTNPTIILQREDCAVPPLEMPRLSIVPNSPWANENWTKVSETD